MGAPCEEVNNTQATNIYTWLSKQPDLCIVFGQAIPRAIPESMLQW